MEVQGIRCPQCGTELAPGTMQCWKCGCQFGARYSQPPQNQPQKPEKKSKKFAIAAFVFSIIGLLLFCTPGGFWLCMCALIFTGISSIVGEPRSGLKTAAIVCGVIGMWLFILIKLLAMGGVFSTNNENTNAASEVQIESESASKSEASSKSESEKESEPQSELELESESEEITLLSEEIEIYNGNGISIVVTDIEESKSEYVVNMTIMNSSEKDYDIAAHGYAVNGFMAGENLYGIGNVEVAAGKKAKLEVDIDRDWMENNGMEDLRTVSILFWAYYDGMKEWDSELVTFETSIYDGLNYSPNGEQVYSDSYMTVWLVGTEGDMAMFVIGNNTSRNAEYTLDNCSVNEWSYDITDYSYDYYDEQILAGTYAVVELEIDEDFLDKYEIESIEEVELTITLTDTYGSYSDWLNVTTDKIKIEF